MTLERLVPLGQWGSTFRVYQRPLEGLSKLRLLDPTPRASDSQAQVARELHS